MLDIFAFLYGWPGNPIDVIILLMRWRPKQWQAMLHLFSLSKSVGVEEHKVIEIYLESSEKNFIQRLPDNISQVQRTTKNEKNISYETFLLRN